MDGVGFWNAFRRVWAASSALECGFHDLTTSNATFDSTAKRG